MKVEPVQTIPPSTNNKQFKDHWKNKTTKKEQQDNKTKDQSTMMDDLSTSKHLWYA